MTRIAHLIAESLTSAEKDALRQLGLGKGDGETALSENLSNLRLIDASWPVRELRLSSLGKEVLGEVILSTGQYVPKTYEVPARQSA